MTIIFITLRYITITLVSVAFTSSSVDQIQCNSVTSTNYQRLRAESSDKDMENLKRWFTDKLALAVGNAVQEKPQVT
jgi:hypothetical protein